MLDVLEIHEDHLVIAGKGRPFVIRHASPELVSLCFDRDSHARYLILTA